MELPQAKSSVRLADVAKEFVILARRTWRETLATSTSKCLRVNDYVLFINGVGNMMAPQCMKTRGTVTTNNVCFAWPEFFLAPQALHFKVVSPVPGYPPFELLEPGSKLILTLIDDHNN